MKLEGSQTEKNLWAAFAGESQARNKYTYFASVAKKEGYEQIADIFTEAAGNEKEHAEIEFKFLKGIGETKDNLKAAAEGEHYEWIDMYPSFAKVAREEGFVEIARVLKEIGEVEEQHEKRYRKLLDNLNKKRAFRSDKIVKWKCRNCGYVHKGTTPPARCPACDHPQSYYELLAENY
jgi:rubrerythrin